MRTGRFKVEIDGVEVPGWQRVKIPSSSTEQGEYRDGGGPGSQQTVWGKTTFDDLEMERGVQPGDTRIFDWREAVRMGNIDEGRKQVAVVLMNEEGQPQVRWEFEGAWVKDYDPPELNAGNDGDVATESIAVAFNNIERVQR